MNKINRICVALFSSLLLFAGLSRAAERLDPLSHQLASTEISANPLDRTGPAVPCILNRTGPAVPCILNVRPMTVPASQLR